MCLSRDLILTYFAEMDDIVLGGPVDAVKAVKQPIGTMSCVLPPQNFSLDNEPLGAWHSASWRQRLCVPSGVPALAGQQAYHTPYSLSRHEDFAQMGIRYSMHKNTKIA